MSTARTAPRTAPSAAPRLRQICLATPTLAPWVAQLQQLFGLGAAYDDPHVAKYGLVNAVLAVGHQFIELVAPVQADAPLHRFLARHPGGAGYIVILDNDDIGARRQHLQALGARLVTDLSHDGFHTLQVHPRDAGACMLEFDHTDGGEAWDGPYAPAGPSWQPQIRLGRATGIAGVVLRSADAPALAARWAALVGVATTADTQGRPQLVLPGGFIAFEAAAPGEADGLVEIVLQLADLPAVLGDAAALGLPVVDGCLALAGMRLRLAPDQAR
jgi:Glyoxalase-like domain